MITERSWNLSFDYAQDLRWFGSFDFAQDYNSLTIFGPSTSLRTKGKLTFSMLFDNFQAHR